VLSCADSRVPPEVIFHTGLGDLFVVRAAGHVPDRSILASLEYGAEHLHIPLLVVMGHEMCGAVKAAIETPANTSLGPNLDFLLKAIRPAVTRTSGQPADMRLRAAILENVEETINAMLDSSAPLKQLAATDRITIAGAYYELASGRVHFSEPVRVPPTVTQTDRMPTAPQERTESRGPAPITPIVASIVPPKPLVQSAQPPAATPAKPAVSLGTKPPAALPAKQAGATPSQPASTAPQPASTATPQAAGPSAKTH
jgi:carbonic anhydrase